MRGDVDVAGHRRRVDLRLTVSIPDLAIFLADPVHAARLDGEITVEGLARSVPVRSGSLHLLAPHDTGRRRTMDYFVPFLGNDGREWLLRGAKEVWWQRGRGPWRATTVLFTSLSAPDDRYEPVRPAGALAISPGEVARLLVSVRPIVRDPALSRGARWRPVARFVGFFVSEATTALMPRLRAAD